MNCSYHNFTVDKTKFCRISSYDNFYLFLIYNSPANIHSSSKSAPSLGLGWYWAGTSPVQPHIILIPSSYHPHVYMRMHKPCTSLVPVSNLISEY